MRGSLLGAQGCAEGWRAQALPNAEGARVTLLIIKLAAAKGLGGHLVGGLSCEEPFVEASKKLLTCMRGKNRNTPGNRSLVKT